ncbi:ABC transporter ATP-binding protein [Ancylobacter amanitiformis]|uniref:ABC-type bacteriocin/lantibiotic exporter with double-glycine peptidase domain n=1 Tax=Ancylobacter amanitiformis TaxID=217069 RepID=A0ABU0LUK6_9HYPH|nr:ABC transporter ATP-binding protein [Ancylobacter amanitiformis]MDQ0512391.1 ABC-type bacteriocin/lantibiotic exporter with double-glycine peptidase domain [Ancylobacter amanitiformis]
MPRTLFQFVWRVSGWHQLALIGMSAFVLVIEIAPIEIQRRIVNDTIKGGMLQPILVLVGAYLAVTVTEGLLKLALNMYRNWLGEHAVLWLREAVFAVADADGPRAVPVATEGIQLSIVLDEADPVGSFVGESISEPVLQAGVFVVVTIYLLYLQPVMALVIAGVFVPQMVFVPIMQEAINRRISTRVTLYRGLSTGIVNARGAHDPDGSQRGKIQAVFATNMSIYWLKYIMNLMMNLMTHGGVATILALGGYFVVTGQTEIGTVVAFLSALSKVNDPWSELVTWYRDMRAAQVKYALLRSAAAIGAIDGNHRG